MELSADSVLSDLLYHRLATTKLGVVVRGIRNINPRIIARSVALRLNRGLATSIIGFDADANYANNEDDRESPPIEWSSTVETAVNWRNQANQYAGRILVFVPGEVDKLGSLHSLDTVTMRDMTLHLIEWVGSNTSRNVPQRKFWEAMRENAATLPFSMLLDYVRAVTAQPDNLNAITTEIWRLGLLEDYALLNAEVDVTERLERNRELITAIGQLSDKSRRRMNQVLQQAPNERQRELRNAAQQLRDFFTTGQQVLLQNLQLDVISQLIEAGRSEPEPSIPQPDDDASDNVRPPKPERTLRGSELNTELARRVVGGSDRAAVAAYVDLVRSQMNDGEAGEDDPVDEEPLQPLTNGRPLTTNVKPQTRTLRSFLAAFCRSDAWGGILRAEQHSMRDVIQRFERDDKAEAFDPAATVGDRPGMVGLLTNIDQQLQTLPGLRATWDAFASARAVLADFLDLLIAEPIGLLYTNDQARQAMDRYLDAYAALLELLTIHRGELNSRFADAYHAILQGLLRLDVVFVATPGEQAEDDVRWKALLTPLHPLHLWRYRTILEKTGPHLTKLEQEQLAEALPSLPHLLHFVAVKDTRLGRITLPLAGAFEGVPIYENRTNRYLGSDGVDFLGDLLRSWLAFAPYSQPHIRLALIDPPYVPDVLRAVRDFLRGRPTTQVVIDAYRTRPQNVLEHLAEMEFEGQDSGVAELLLDGKVSLNLEECDSLNAVMAALARRPMHITYSFDQSSYDLTKSNRHRHLVVSPLVITYEYTFDEAYKRGSIAPSSDAQSGIFAHYHTLLNQAIDLQEDQSFQVQIGSGADIGALNGLLRNGSTRWLAVADRTLLGYAPDAAVPLVEQLQGRREVAVWAHATSRSVSQFAVMLRERYNLAPDEAHLVHLMQKYGHIAAGGLFSTVRGNSLSGAQRDKQRKGLIGTVLAAHWYTTQYPGALVASLDSGLARQWLALQTASRERADLIGLRQAENGNLIIDIIEVKAVEQAQKEVQVRLAGATRQPTLTGPAVDQLRATLNVVTPIFRQDQERLDLFGQARREALKYQLFRECYREIHSDDDQFRWHKSLNAAFREPSAQFRPDVRCQGLVVHLSFEENGADEIHLDSMGDVTLVRLRTPRIQALLTNTPLRPPGGSGQPGPASPPPPELPPTPPIQPTSLLVQPPAQTGTLTGGLVESALPSPAAPTASPAQVLQPPLFAPETPTSSTASPLPAPQQSAVAVSVPAFDILLGDTKPTEQYGVLGRYGNKVVALDLNGTNTISIFGVQGGGKSYTVGTVVEMATQSFPGANLLPSPLASVIFHYHASQDYPPEFVSMVAPNSKAEEIRTLQELYGATPGRLADVLILTSADKVADRRAEFPSIQVEPILFSSSEITIKDWQFLMGVFGDQMYMKQVTLIMRRLRAALTLEGLRDAIEASDLSDNQKLLVSTRLDFAEPFINDAHRLAGVLRPGRLVIVDLRDELITKEEALGLFVVMLNIFASAGRDQNFNKLIVFDEAHKYMNDDELAGYIVEVVRQMRHQGVSILIASQDPPSLPTAIIELSTLVVLHRFNSPKWLKHVQQAQTALSDLQPGQLANLQPGEAFVWATKATDNSFMRHAVKMRFRPRVTQHGGGTKTAV